MRLSKAAYSWQSESSTMKQVREISARLGGLMTIMPITFTITLIGAFSMAGLPPFNGFLSKEMFFTSMLRITNFNLYNADTWGFLFPVLAWIGSVFTFIYCMVLLFKTFGGKYQPEKLEKQAHEAPIGMLISPIVLVSLVVIFFFFPNILSYSIIEPAAASIMPTLLDGDEKFKVHIYMWHGFSTEALYDDRRRCSRSSRLFDLVKMAQGLRPLPGNTDAEQVVRQARCQGLKKAPTRLQERI